MRIPNLCQVITVLVLAKQEQRLPRKELAFMKTVIFALKVSMRLAIYFVMLLIITILTMGYLISTFNIWYDYVSG